MATVEGAFPGALCRPPEGPGEDKDPPPDPPSLALPRGGRRRRRRRRTTTSCRKKHKMEEEPEDVPAAKKRLVEEMLLGTGMAEWALSAGQPPPQPLHCLPGPLDAPCEEMEQATVEPQCEAARRRLQEIEARIIDEEEEEEQEGEKGLLGAGGPTLPTLVLSDTLKTGLKQDYEGVLTKKIIESMSRPSMELVLWKPLPAFLTERAQPVSARNYKAEHPLTKPESLETAFLSPVDGFADQPPAEMPPALPYGAVDSLHAAEEEMEL